MEITLGLWQVWITDREPSKYRLVRECMRRSDALNVAAELIEKGCYYGVEVVKKTRFYTMANNAI